MKADKTNMSRISNRSVVDENDFWKLRQFLIDTWPQMPPFYNWETRRLDGSYFHNERAGWETRWEGGKAARVWEAANGQLVGAVHPEGKGQAWLEVHQDYRHLEAEMLDWAEAHLAQPNKASAMGLKVFAWEYDTRRQKLLASRGYQRMSSGDILREKPYDGKPIVVPSMPMGYRLHCVRPGHAEDCKRYAELLNASFKRTFHKAQELVTFTTQSPSFRSELELVAVAPDGKFAALAGMIYDEDNRFGSFEPVCATPGPRPLGLTGILMLEGYRRVRELGAEHCYVGTGTGMAANRFYAAVGFKIIHTGWFWVKETKIG